MFPVLGRPGLQSLPLSARIYLYLVSLGGIGKKSGLPLPDFDVSDGYFQHLMRFVTAHLAITRGYEISLPLDTCHYNSKNHGKTLSML